MQVQAENLFQNDRRSPAGFAAAVAASPAAAAASTGFQPRLRSARRSIPLPTHHRRPAPHDDRASLKPGLPPHAQAGGISTLTDQQIAGAAMAFEANVVLAAVMTVNLLHALTDQDAGPARNLVATPATSARNCAKVRVMATRRLIAVWTIATIVLAASGGFVAYRLVHPPSSSASVLHGQIVWPSHKRPGSQLRAPRPGWTPDRAVVVSAPGRGARLPRFPMHPTLPPRRPRAGRRPTQPAGGRPAELVVVSVDPADTPRSVHVFASFRSWREPWYWLMGSVSQLRPVWHAYGIEVRSRRRKVAGVRFTSIAHSAALYVIDPAGDERSGYLMPFSAHLVAENVRALSSGSARAKLQESGS